MKEDFLMTLNKAEAIHTLAVHMGISDGDFSKDEISRLEHNPKFKEMSKIANYNIFDTKINPKELTIDSAVQTLKSLDLNGQIEALSIIWHILIADGIMQPGESVLMNNLLTEFNIKIETISNNLQEMLS